MQPDHNNLGQYAVLIETERMAARISAAQGAVRKALHACPEICISLSGGKDSVAAAIIARSVAPAIPIVTARPPNALPYRDAHMAELKDWFGGPWVEVDYPWDVARVLDGRERYPAGLKVRTLLGLSRPGYILGLRIAESRARQIAYRKHGAVYQTQTGWRCLPVATWSAEEVIGLASYFGAPIAEPYRLPLLGLSLDDVRDGTWWSHRADVHMDDWMARNYPAQHAYWLRASEIEMAARREGF